MTLPRSRVSETVQTEFMIHAELLGPTLLHRDAYLLPIYYRPTPIYYRPSRVQKP